MKLLKKPYNLFLILASIILLSSFFDSDESSAFDLHIHDTYFVIANAHVFIIVAIFLILLWFIYFVSQKILFSKFLSWLHIACTLIGVFILCILPFLEENIFLNKQRNYYDYTSWGRAGGINAILAFVIFFGQFILVFHFIVGIVKLVRKQ